MAESLTGWSREDAVGRSLAEVFRIVDGTTREACRNPMELAIQQDRTVGLAANSILIRRDGVESAVEDSAAPIHDRQGRVTGAVIVFHDVSAAKAMTVQMSELRATRCADGFAESRLSERPHRAGDHRSRIVTKASSRCCFWIWITSNTSTIRWDIRSATRFCNPWQDVWCAACAIRIP